MGKSNSKLEKSVGFGLAVTGILGIGWIAAKVLGGVAGILALLGTGMNALVGGAAIIALILFFRHPKIKTACWYGYQSIVSKAVGIFVTTNKLEIVKNYLVDLKDNSEDMMTHINGFKANLMLFKNDILKSEKDREKYAQEASYFKEKGNSHKSKYNSALSRIARLGTSIEKLKLMYNNELFLCKKFMKIYEVSVVVIDDLEYDIELQVKEFELAKKHHKAMKNGLSALGADKNKKAMYEAAVDKMQSDIAKKAAEIDTFMNITSQIVSDADMKMSLQESKGAQMLEEWEKNGGFDTLLDGVNGAEDISANYALDSSFVGYEIESDQQTEKVKVKLTKQPVIEEKYSEILL